MGNSYGIHPIMVDAGVLEPLKFGEKIKMINDPNKIKDREGDNLYAYGFSNKEPHQITKILLDNNVDKYSKNKFGDSALDRAKRGKNHLILETFLNFGGDIHESDKMEIKEIIKKHKPKPIPKIQNSFGKKLKKSKTKTKTEKYKPKTKSNTKKKIQNQDDYN